MKRLDKLVYKELLGPWMFGVAMFTVLIAAASFLFKASDFFVQGVAPGVVLLFVTLKLPGIIVKTFAMAVLLATLLAFGRLSSDSEIVAIRASGVSVFRIMLPVAIFSILVALVAFGIDETVVPVAAKRTLYLEAEILRKIDSKSTQSKSQNIPGKEPGSIAGQLVAKDVDIAKGTLSGATVIVYGDKGAPNYYLYADRLDFDAAKAVKAKETGDYGFWHIHGGALLTSADGRNVIHFDDEVWPNEVPKPSITLEQFLTDNVKDLDTFSMSQIQAEIEKEKSQPKPRMDKIHNYEYGYWNKIALPLAALVYGLLGAPLGIRNARTGTATGFALSVGIIFGYVTIANMLNVFAMGGKIPAYAASFTPLVIGLLASGVIMWRRNA